MHTGCDSVMKSELTLLSFCLLTLLSFSCAPKPAATASSPNPQPTTAVSATPRPTPLPSASVSTEAKIQQILTSNELNLKVDEELLLIGDVLLSNGTKVSLDSVMPLLKLDNQNPDLLNLNAETRLVRALKAGTALVTVASKAQPDLKVLVTVRIETPAPGIDPNAALVDVEIE